MVAHNNRQLDIYLLPQATFMRDLSKLLAQILRKGHRILCLCSDSEKVQSLDQQLWIGDQLTFLPHGTIKDPYPELQPILLTSDESENYNNSDVIVSVLHIAGRLSGEWARTVLAWPRDHTIIPELNVESEHSVSINLLPTELGLQLQPYHDFQINIVATDTVGKWHKLPLDLKL